MFLFISTTHSQLKSRFLCSVTEEMGKPGSDAGMPGIEDSEVGKIDDIQFGKKLSLNFQEKFFL